jgi:SAM-dependent methyltransferase
MSGATVAKGSDPAVHNDKLTYRRGRDLEEWFVNRPSGLEHGYVVHKRPSNGLSFRLAVRGDLRASGSGDALQLTRNGVTTLTYSGLKVWDATGKPLPARMTGYGNEIELSVDDTQARYPVTVDPTVQQAYLKASNTGANDNFGYSVAISGDTVVVGAYAEASSTTGVNSTPNDSAANSGAAADLFRVDLCRPDCGNGNGCYGFTFRLPHSSRFLGRYAVQARVRDIELVGSPIGVFESVDLPYRLPPPDFRRWLAAQYLWGRGAEFGLLQPPLPVPPGAQVPYLPGVIHTNEGLKRRHGVNLATAFAPGSQDFVILNHTLHYAPDPVEELVSALVSTRIGGCVYVAVPQRDQTPSRRRPESHWEELVGRHVAGPEIGVSDRISEWVRLAEAVPEWDHERRVSEILADPALLIEHSCWSALGFFEFVARVRNLTTLRFELRAAHTMPGEAVVVLERN